MSAHFDLRRIDPDDLPRLQAIDPRLAADPRHSEHIRALLALGMSWAAQDAEALIGFAVVSRQFYGYPFVDLLRVSEPARRRGAGSALMAQCVAAHEADRIFTSTNESNAPMRALLAKAGWRPAGVIHYLDPGDPELIFVKPRG